MRRAKALHAPALLIDQDRRIGASDAGTKGIDEPAHLIGRVDIALEQDKTPGLVIAVKGDLFARQFLVGTTDNQGLAMHGYRPVSCGPRSSFRHCSSGVRKG